MPLVTLVCQYAPCGKEFQVKPYRVKDNPRFCSATCMGLNKRTPEEIAVCAFCGNPFTIRRINEPLRNQRYCSRQCGLRDTGKARISKSLVTFWEKVAHCEHEWLCIYCCWPWEMGLSSKGFGKATREGKTVLAHVWAWELWHNRPFPPGMESLHECDNRACCNPMHMRPATHTEVMQHAKNKGALAAGSQHFRSLFTEDDIPRIFTLHHEGLSAPAIAEQYHASSSTIIAILHRKTWIHVPIDDALIPLREKPRPFTSYTTEEKRAYWRQWYAAHTEACLARAARYKAEHLEEIQAQQRQHKKEIYPEHAERIHEKNVAYYANNTDKVREQNAEYQRTHPEKVQVFQQRRRAKKLATRNDFTAEQWEEILAVWKHRCAYCGKKSKRLEIEHITPLSKGGEHTASNIVPACRSCNAKKHAGPPPVPVQPLLLTVAPPKKDLIV